MEFHSSNRVLGGSLFIKKEPLGKSWVCELFTSTYQRIKELVPTMDFFQFFDIQNFCNFFQLNIKFSQIYTGKKHSFSKFPKYGPNFIFKITGSDQ